MTSAAGHRAALEGDRPSLGAFRTLNTSDPDVAWIVRTNLAKKRLARLL